MNLLSPINFAVKIDSVPDIEYLVQAVSIPGISTPDVSIPNPFTKIRAVPNRIEFEPSMIMQFKVGESLEGWIDIYNWLERNTRPTTFDSYSKQVSDGSVIILNSKRRPNIKFTFRDMFPVSLSKIDLAATAEDVQYVTAQAEFAYTSYTVESI